MVAVGSVAQEWDLQAGTAPRCPDPLRVEVAALRGAGPELRLPGAVDRLDLVGPPRAVDVGRHPAHRLRHGALEHLRWAAPPGRPGQRRRVDRAALVARRPPAAAGPRHRHGRRPWPFTQPPTCEPLGRWSRTEAVVGCGSSVQVNTYDRPRRSAAHHHAASGRHPPARAVVWPTTGSPGGAARQPLLRVPGDALRPTATSRRSRCRRPRPAWSPTWPSGARSTSAAPGALRRRPARGVRPAGPAGSPSWPDRVSGDGRSGRPWFSRPPGDATMAR